MSIVPPIATQVRVTPHNTPVDNTPVKLCDLVLQSGCYHTTFTSDRKNYVGTMRVEYDDVTKSYVISGDLYEHGSEDAIAIPARIPIYPRLDYRFYIKVTQIEMPQSVPENETCSIRLTTQQYTYQHPDPNGLNRYSGIFLMPASSLTVVLFHTANGIYEGTREGSITDTFTMQWISSNYRRAEIKIDTVKGAKKLPAGITRNNRLETLTTVYASANWEVNFFYDTQIIPLPKDVTGYWTHSSLHRLMSENNDAATNGLDTIWRFHLLIVPYVLKDRNNRLRHDLIGLMYDDAIFPHREGAAVFYGAFHANRKYSPHDICYFLIAAHESGHGFNMPHPNGASEEDSCIMTPIKGIEAYMARNNSTFPNEILLSFNSYYRHRLIHFPDPFVRPGGMKHVNYWYEAGGIPLAAVIELDDSEVMMNVSTDKNKEIAVLKLGEPLRLNWTLTKQPNSTIALPEDVSREADQVDIRVLKANGEVRAMPAYVIYTDHFEEPDAGHNDAVSGNTDLFWSSEGFAFPEPGDYTVEIRVRWRDGEKNYQVKGHQKVVVEPANSAQEKKMGTQLLHRAVGVSVALGGKALHLKEAVQRIEAAIATDAQHSSAVFFKTLPDSNLSTNRGAKEKIE